MTTTTISTMDHREPGVETIFSKRVFCSDCGTRLPLLFNLRGHRDEGVYLCKAVKDTHLECLVTKPQLLTAVENFLDRESTEAVSMLAKLTAMKESGLLQQMDAGFQSQLDALTERIRQNCREANTHALTQFTPGPLPSPWDVWWNERTGENLELAGRMADLAAVRYRFRQPFVKGNAWADLYAAFPAGQEITRYTLKKYVRKISISHEGTIHIEGMEQDAKAELIWCLAFPEQNNRNTEGLP